MLASMQLGSPTILTPRTVGSLTGRFFVPDYQRGYRWGQDEVRRLLDDIKEAGAANYYLQPIVVKPTEGHTWELVDGQQRLTTLYLVMRCLKEYLPKLEIRYQLEYETRLGSANFLDNPEPELANTNIDYFHMYTAWKEIERWLEQQPDSTDAASRLHSALINTVHVIWYQAPQEPGFDSRAMFTRLNVGRIPLTDAELVKALLLTRIDRPHETAAQWDTIERDLWSPELWAFVTASTEGSATRIDLLLDTVADRIAGRQRGPHPAPFQTFETLRPLIVERPNEIWNQVVDLHSQIQGWHDDRDLFHKIGYLRAARRRTFFDLVDLAEGTTKSDFNKVLDGLIADSLKLAWHGVQALSYTTSKTSQVLLLMNVEAVRRNKRSHERYSFDAHARRLWSLEHIHAQNSQGLDSVDQWKAWLVEHRDALDALHLDEVTRSDLTARINEALPTISFSTFDPLHQELVATFSPDGDTAEADNDGLDEVDSIANLALLDRDDNSLLNNSVFEIKRRHVINLDRQGSYIPVCTRNVFLKYYTDGGTHLHFWGRQDRVGYLAAMKSLLEPYLLPDEPSSEALDETEDGAA